MVINSKSKLMNIKHRHIVFTIPDSLRNLFLVDRIRINFLFESVIETFNWIFNHVSFHNKQKKKFVNMTCTKCNKTDYMPYDIYMEMLDI